MKNKKKRKNFRVINVILTVILLIGIGILGVAVFAFRMITKEETAENKYYTAATVTDEVMVECIGKKYEVPAEDGYTFYRLTFPVENRGTEAFERVIINIAKDGSYEDFDTYYSENEFTYTDEKIVPPSQRGYVETIIQAKDGLDSIDAIYYDSFNEYYAEENPHEFVIQLR